MLTLKRIVFLQKIQSNEEKIQKRGVLMFCMKVYQAHVNILFKASPLVKRLQAKFTGKIVEDNLFQSKIKFRYFLFTGFNLKL